VWGKILKLTSIQSCREEILEALHQCRVQTLNLFAAIDSDTFYLQVHPDFSPVGWHLGHIGFTEAYWILERCAGYGSLFPQYKKLFAADGLPKAERANLPSLEVIQNYLDTVRSKVFHYLATAPLEREERLWRWLIQHESQHNETIIFILQLHHWQNNLISRPVKSQKSDSIPNFPDMVEIPPGEFMMGSNAIDAQDNERPAHQVYLDTYWIDRYPVTCRQYREFMTTGGYQNRQWWSEEGWQWLKANSTQPLYWSDSKDWDNHPVCGVSWYEAEAYANFAGKRLPTEAEWEKAASWHVAKGQKITYPWGEARPNKRFGNYDSLIGQTTPVNAYSDGQSPYGCYDMLGNVWEWTASWFAGYDRFTSYPYPGYSQTYFDQQHRVLKGGSWATRSWGLRASFRNWYHPWVRQILAGFRCARDRF
jgi:ergothioneine biosynthesis protein EgtB